MEEEINPQQLLKAQQFKALHERDEIFVMPCAWNPLTAIMFEELGFECVGTTSGGVNWDHGRRDFVYSIPRDEMLESYGAIAKATSLPVSGDLENGYGETPEEVAETIRASIAYGMAGGSVEDMSMVNSGRLVDTALAIERIKTARLVADQLCSDYVLTARCEVYSTDHKQPYSVTVERLNCYREAGADCLFVPGLSDITGLKNLVRDVDGPISFGMGATDQPLSVNDLAEIGIRRISTGGGLPRAAFSLIRDAAQEILNDGAFSYLDNAISDPGINEYLGKHNSI